MDSTPPKAPSNVYSNAQADRETIARALALTDDCDGCFERLDAWVTATEEEREHREVEEPLSTDTEDAEFWLRRADAVLAVLPTFEVYEHYHYCTPGCDDECDIRRVRTWSRTEVIERRQPMTDEEFAEIEASIERIRAERADRGIA